MDWAAEIAWCAELLAMWQRWCDIRTMDERWYDDVYERRRWVRMNMRLGDSQSHNITALRLANVKPRWVYDACGCGCEVGHAR